MQLLLNFLIIFSFIYILVVSLTYLFVNQGYTLPNFISSIMPSFKIQTKNQTNNKSYTSKDLIKVAISALMFRVLLLVISFVAFIVLDNHSEASLIDFINEITEWDCNNYYRISKYGYGYWKENGYMTTLVFFPLYPFIARIFNFFIHNTHIALLIVSIFSYVGGCVYLYALITKEYSKELASKVVLYISIFPYSFFFGTMMPESLFFLLISATLYYINEHRWLVAAIFGMLATTTRLQGILIIIPFIIEIISHYDILKHIKNKEVKSLKTPLFKLLYIPIYFIGIGIYLLCNFIYTGNALYFLKLQEKVWKHSFDLPGSAVYSIIRQLRCPFIVTNYHRFDATLILWLPELILFISVLIFMIYSANKLKPKYMLYLLVYFFISFASDVVLSGGRYMSVAIPLFIILANFTKKHPLLDKWFTYACLSFNILFSICYIFGADIV